MTLAATTVSIILTFGTTAIIDRRKERSEKREMVRMIMYDMRETLKEFEQVNEGLESFFNVQVDLMAHPDQFAARQTDLAVHLPFLQYTNTTENIFRTNVETIQTIGNILFVETVSSFYDERARYKSVVVDDFLEKANVALSSCEKLRDFDSASYPFYAGSFLRSMQTEFEQCKLMMKVTEEELDVFSRQQQKFIEATKGDITSDVSKASREAQERKSRWQKAREEGLIK